VLDDFFADERRAVAWQNRMSVLQPNAAQGPCAERVKKAPDAAPRPWSGAFERAVQRR
jgi:hypothetical protein